MIVKRPANCIASKAKTSPMDWKIHRCHFRINIKERQLEDVRYELRALEEKNERHKERVSVGSYQTFFIKASMHTVKPLI